MAGDLAVLKLTLIIDLDAHDAEWQKFLRLRENPNPMKTPEKPDTWMPLFIGKYLADTTHLARDQHGGYLLLLFALWMKGGRLPDDDGQLANIAKASLREWRALRPVLAPFFNIADGWWTKKRLGIELALASQRQAKNTAKASLGAAARWGKPVDKNASSIPPSNAPSMPQAMLEDMPGQCPVSLPLSKPVVTPTDTAPAREHGNSGHKNGLEKQSKPNGNWRTVADLAAAEATRVGIKTRPGESLPQLVERIDRERERHA